MTLIPVLVFWAIIALGVVMPARYTLYILFGAFAFSGMAAIPTEFIGGLTVTPFSIASLLVIFRTAMLPGALPTVLRWAVDFRALGLLTLFTATAVLLTLFSPRAFDGIVYVIPFRGDLSEETALHPTTQNLSQMGYLLIDILVVYALSYFLQTKRMRQTFIRAVIFGALVVITTGFLDWLSTFANIDPFLDLFRTGSYSFMTDVEVLGLKRVVGLAPEASSYGSLCMTLLGPLFFLRRAIDGTFTRRILLPPVLFSLAVFAALSTSSAAYVSLVILIGLIGFDLVLRLVTTAPGSIRRRGLRGEIIALSVAAPLALAVFLGTPAVFDPAIELFDRMVLQKTETSSFSERMMWSQVSFDSLVATYGLGVGVGSTRASSSVISVLSATGILGALLFYGFHIQTLFRRAAPDDPEGISILYAVRLGIVPSLVTGLLIGVGVKFIGSAMMIGLASSVGLAAFERRRVGDRVADLSR